MADFVADMLKVFIKAPDTDGIFKLVENYPRPSNAEWLKTPQLGKQVAASIPKRSNNSDSNVRGSCPDSLNESASRFNGLGKRGWIFGAYG